MKANPTEQELVTFVLEPDTMGVSFGACRTSSVNVVNEPADSREQQK